MKSRSWFKRIGLCAFLLVFSVFYGVTASAFAAEDDLPVVEQWVNGAAQSSTGAYLYDTWAYDDTGVSEYKYVLINQNSTEEFRVKNYPDDIENGETHRVSQYTVSFEMSVPSEITDEVSVTFKSDGATYTLSFNEANSYKTSSIFYPGDYTVSDIEVITDDDVSYGLSENPSFSVKDKNLKCSMTLVSNGTGHEDSSLGSMTSDVDESESSETSDVGTLDYIKEFDTNGDLLGDTIKLFIAIVILFGIYAFIKYRRKKKEELQR